MPDSPLKENDTPDEHEEELDKSSKEPERKSRIQILRERDIPFEEERPPNFSPYYSIIIHGKKKRSELKERES
ncbi:MAG: hypothetical protein ACFE9D_04490 [Promethearchaeota archaeon]